MLVKYGGWRVAFVVPALIALAAGIAFARYAPDETLPPATVDSTRRVMEPYAKRFRLGRVEGLHHYLFTQDSIKVVGTMWFRYIESGFFD